MTRLHLSPAPTAAQRNQTALDIARRGEDVIVTCAAILNRRSGGGGRHFTLSGRKAIALPLDMAQTTLSDFRRQPTGAALASVWGPGHLPDHLINNTQDTAGTRPSRNAQAPVRRAV